MELVFARTEDIDQINMLVEESESYSYGKLFDLDTFRKHYRISKSKLHSTKSYSVMEDGNIIGFAMIIHYDNQYELEYFYLCKSKIGKGYGKNLWNLLIEKCQEDRVDKFHIACSKNITPFYLKMGAVYVSELRSKLDPERRIDKLMFIVK